VVAKHFDLDSFVELGADAIHNELDTNVVFNGLLENTRDCGTTGCAVGWCPAVFPKYFEYDQNENVVGRRHLRGVKIFDLAMRFFNITQNEALSLFSPDFYSPTYKDHHAVAGRIYGFVHNRKKYGA
jgi:hypothetical protein